MKKSLIPVLSIGFAIALCLIAILCQTVFAHSGESSDSHIHEFKKVVDEEFLKTEADCETKAVYYLSCSCGAKSEETFEDGDYAHIVVIDEAVPETCEDSGLTEGKHCSRCNKILVEQIIIPAQHIFTDGICTRCNLIEPDGIDRFAYTILSDGTYSVSSVLYLNPYISQPRKLVIPDSYKGKPVTQIGEKAFADIWITHIVIPNSITSIGDSAFRNCKYLESVNIPDSVVNIGFSAFYNCSNLKRINIPAKVSDISGYTFYRCSSLEEITVSENNEKYIGINNCLIEKETKTLILGCKNSIIPDDGSVITIDSYAFEGCNKLISITIPASIEKIYFNSFVGCSGLEKIEVAPGNATYISKDNCLINKNTETLVLGCKNSIIPKSGVTTLGVYAFKDNDSLINIYIPGNITNIESGAFENCKGLTDVVIAHGLTTIEGFVFYGCGSLKNITIPESVTSIGSCAFYECENLKSITIPDGIEKIEFATFQGCSSLSNIAIPDSVTIIESFAFNSCMSLVNLTIPNSVTSLEKGAFLGCVNLTNITIPESISIIESYTFSECESLTDITIPESITRIEDGAFYSCISLKNITIPFGVTNIEKYTFFNCRNLASITIPESITSIGESAFSGCIGLTSINIPKNVSFIDKNAFCGCGNLEEITVSEDNEKYICINNCLINKKSKTLILGCNNSIIPTDGSVTRIEEYAFKNCANLTSVVIPDYVTDIGIFAFSGCSGLESVILPENLTTINSYVFSDCAELSDISLPNSLTSIGYNAFLNCVKLTELYFPENITSIAPDAFEGCSSLEKIDVAPENKMYFGKDNCLIEIETKTLLLGCKNSVIPEDKNVTDIGVYSFNNCVGLRSLHIPRYIKFISSAAFVGCINLEKVTISNLNPNFCVKNNCLISLNGIEIIASWKNSVIPTDKYITEIGGSSFKGRNNLTSIEIPENITTIGGHAFANCNELTSVIIPNSVTRIYCGAFAGCSNLTSITITNSIFVFECDLFNGCKNLTQINFIGTKFEWESIRKELYWNSDTGDFIVYCSDGKLDKNGNEIA